MSWSGRRLLEDPLEGLRAGFSTVPTLSHQEAPVTQEFVEAVLTAFAEVACHPFRQHGLVLDGVEVGVEIPGRAMVGWNEGDRSADAVLAECLEATRIRLNAALELEP